MLLCLILHRFIGNPSSLPLFPSPPTPLELFKNNILPMNKRMAQQSPFSLHCPLPLNFTPKSSAIIPLHQLPSPKANQHCHLLPQPLSLHLSGRQITEVSLWLWMELFLCSLLHLLQHPFGTKPLDSEKKKISVYCHSWGKSNVAFLSELLF